MPAAYGSLRVRTIEVRGTGATAARLALVDSAAAKITSLTNGEFAVRRVDRGGHAIMRLDPLDSLRAHAPGLTSRMEETGSVAYFTVWTRGYAIGGGSVVIRSELQDHEVNSLILEEVTQVIGLFRDSPQVPGSIVYETPSDGGWAQWYHPIDERVIGLLYDPAILPGMRYERARTAAREVLLQGQ